MDEQTKLINNRFVRAEKKVDYTSNKEIISKDSIVFVKETNQIINDGISYGGPSFSNIFVSGNVSGQLSADRIEDTVIIKGDDLTTDVSLGKLSGQDCLIISAKDHKHSLPEITSSATSSAGSHSDKYSQKVNSVVSVGTLPTYSPISVSDSNHIHSISNVGVISESKQSDTTQEVSYITDPGKPTEVVLPSCSYSGGKLSISFGSVTPGSAIKYGKKEVSAPSHTHVITSELSGVLGPSTSTTSVNSMTSPGTLPEIKEVSVSSANHTHLVETEVTTTYSEQTTGNIVKSQTN